MTVNPRRCGKRWLDGDCPRDVLAIIDHGADQMCRYDVIYTDVQTVTYDDSPRIESWLQGVSITDRGAFCDHFEMQAHEVAAYRYRMKHRYTKWSTLPEPVKAAVRKEIEEMASWTPRP